MPELPEVETIRLGLDELIVGKTIDQVLVINPSSFPNKSVEVDRYLIGASVEKLKRRAKILIIDLSTEYALVIHLKMTGQLVYVNHQHRFGAGHPNDSLVGSLPDKSTRVILHFDDNSTLFFNDQRKFGWVKILPKYLLTDTNFFKLYGPEPLQKKFNLATFKSQLLKHSKTSIKAALLNQSIIAGIGNIYADESLWLARIHPKSLIIDLTDDDVARLFKSIIAVLKLSLQKGGSTSRNYLNAKGNKGNYLKFANVYGREGQPCLNCGQPIIKIRVASRGTHICLKCQQLK